MNPLLIKILDSDSARPLGSEEMEQLRRQYPAFTLPLLMAVKNRTATQEELARLAISLPDINSLRDITGENADIFANFYPAPEKATPSTMETIDSFLATYGTSANPRETEALEKAIFNPVPDYGALLAAEEKDSVPKGEELDENVVGAHDAAINRFIANSKGRTQLPEISREPEKDTDAGTLSESLARIMIKNHNYTKALQIISGLHLNNPEKSIYFAHQIRFLRKLIAIENKKQQ